MSGDGRRTADVLILGAGVMGASIAFHLARRRAGRIAVVDKGDVAHGGSGRSSALVRMHYSFPPEVRLAATSLAMFRDWREVVGRPGDFRRTGFVRIVPAGELDRLRANVAMQRSLGVDTRVLTAVELREVAPGWSFEDVEAAAYEPDSGYGDGAGVANDLLSRAREMGAAYHPGTRVSALRAAGGRVRGVETDRGPIEAPVVVAATGPWSRPLLAQVGFDLPVEPEFHQVAILRNPGALPSVGPACIDSILAVYFRSEVGGLTLVGGFYGRRGVDPDDYPQAAEEDALVSLASAIARRVPALEDASLARGITGVYDMSPDARPILGEVPGVAGLHVVAGFSGMGFKISPAVGLVMSELLLDGRATTVDLTPFRPGRFAEGQPIKAEFEYRDD
ncbi:MAG TPA: FAD-binding oxidoreductase [Vicinamibacteria bacterium]|nr:FAD-binding oxidoreductase [Vicinamibacteria bacterium]